MPNPQGRYYLPDIPARSRGGFETSKMTANPDSKLDWSEEKVYHMSWQFTSSLIEQYPILYTYRLVQQGWFNAPFCYLSDISVCKRFYLKRPKRMTMLHETLSTDKFIQHRLMPCFSIVKMISLLTLSSQY